ncbi:MAG: MoaD/ThiS family protein, partial [Acidimicrobiales bacterium]
MARAELDGSTVAELLAAAETSFGERFTAVLASSRVWVNGEPATAETPVAGHDVVAVLPPVSGGAGDVAVDEAPPRRPVERPNGAVCPPPAPPRPQARPTRPVADPGPMAGLGGGLPPRPPSARPGRSPSTGTSPRPGPAPRSEGRSGP